MEANTWVKVFSGNQIVTEQTLQFSILSLIIFYLIQRGSLLEQVNFFKDVYFSGK